jgi:conjugative relaxase-like TrwC/TraI family protein
MVANRDFAHDRGEMLRITQCVSAQGAVKYFDVALCRSDYYTAEHGIWGGKAAERLGLRGEVTRDDFLALTSNKIPGTEQTLTVRTKDNRTAGYDMCFRSPKAFRCIWLKPTILPLSE